MDFCQSFFEFIRVKVFEQIGAGAGPQHSDHRGIIAFHGKGDNAGKRVPLADKYRCGSTIQIRHIHIEQNNRRRFCG